MDQFAAILDELGQVIGTPLHPDGKGLCTLNVNEVLHIQIGFQSSERSLLIICMICEISAGKFRENTLKDGLRSNWPYPVDGTLCYAEKNNQLCLFEKVPLENLSGHKLLLRLNAFIAKADSWRTGVERGQTTNLISSIKRSGSGIFGLS